LIERIAELQPGEGERTPLGSGPVLVVLPGSRRTEISRLLGPFGEAVGKIAAARPDVEVLLPAVPHLSEEIAAAVSSWPRRPRLILSELEKFAAFRRAHAALAASGTVTLELALAGVPMVVAYRVDPIARFLKRFLTIHSIVLPNLVLGENPIPEFLDADSDPDTLASNVLALLGETSERSAQVAALKRVGEAMLSLGAAPPSNKAAEIVIEAAEHGRGRRVALLAKPLGP
jgi:lipid-A-disaccharide synthase